MMVMVVMVMVMSPHRVLTPPKCPLSYSFATIAHFTSVNVLKCAADSSTLHSMKLNWFVFLLHFPASQWLGSFWWGDASEHSVKDHWESSNECRWSCKHLITHRAAPHCTHCSPLHTIAPHSPLGGMSSVEARSKLHHLGRLKWHFWSHTLTSVALSKFSKLALNLL